MGTFSRIRYVIAANLNALIEKAEDPEKLLRALIREMEEAGDDARLAVADLLAEQSHLERLDGQLAGEIAEWQQRAELAVNSNRDDLARAAIAARTELEARRQGARTEREALAGRITQLETDMTTLKAKLAEAQLRLKEIQGRARTPSAGTGPAEERLSTGEKRMREALHRFDRLQNQVERLEARVRSYEVGGIAPSPWREALPADPAVEAELEALKAKLQPAPEVATAATPASA